ncbi:MAG: AmmeMemoRadiSam system protein A [Deltaproteobacteria bacterium]|nr:AmmeMemoRadiSam system protein A [Deltaproteobacteria bacterium]
MPLTETDKKTLLSVAREAIEGRVTGAKAAPAAIDADGPLAAAGGAFVSLHKGERLRGCIGMITSDKPLWKTVAEMARSAATADPRFEPVDARELKSIWIEVSLLGPLKPVLSTVEIEPGRHGLYIIKGRRSGLLLPQVAVELGLGREEFLDQTCLKAGLPLDAWRDGKAMIFTFEAEIVREG